jgi:phosphatidate phosphatase APP1
MPPPLPPGSPHTPTEPQSLPPSPTSLIPTAITCERVPLTYSPIRVISDIDDTVKLSGIQSGLRTMFQNVFVKDLEENLISGMGEWYTEMWRCGVRFHYVVSSQPSASLSTRKLKFVKCRSQTVLSRSFP